MKNYHALPFILIALLIGCAKGTSNSSLSAHSNSFIGIRCPSVQGLNLFEESQYNIEELDQIVQDTSNQLPERLIDYLSGYQNLAVLYGRSALVSEGYTLREHSLRTLQQYIFQYEYFYRSYSEHGVDHNIRKLMLVFLALHDIGKPCGNTSGEQFLYTSPILQRVLGFLNFTTADIQLALELVKNDPIGLYLRRMMPVNTAAQIITTSANRLNLPLNYYYKIILSYYISDSSSYPALLSSLYRENNNRLTFQPTYLNRILELETQLRIPPLTGVNGQRWYSSLNRLDAFS